MLCCVEAIEADIADVDIAIEIHLAPVGDAATRLIEIPGVGPAAARTIMAEIGLDMTRFPTPAHLSAWARFAPSVTESAGRRKGTGSTGHGNPYLARVLGQIAVGAARTNTFLGQRYRRIARRRGAKRAIVAVGRSVLTIIWHLLSDPQTHFNDLGADFYNSRTDTSHKKRRHTANSKPWATESSSNQSPSRQPPNSATRSTFSGAIPVRDLACAPDGSKCGGTRGYGCAPNDTERYSILPDGIQVGSVVGARSRSIPNSVRVPARTPRYG